ncbi:NudC domain-containing protein 1 [Clonorchis sinensis]|uniref:NudC domain-containing protein 1 n=1 Tax=Clonorchis sinensis TaxID=79923 RepID=A0A8T1MDR1_CLOSI|nr:NudC domain-containing protein 1 [Clonorchis sinensis]
MNVTLRPDRTLLDPNFESYKLSLEKIPQFHFSASNKIAFKSLPESLSKQHVQSFSHQNCLTLDPFVQGDLYYIELDGCIKHLRIPQCAHNFRQGTSVYSFPKWSDVTSKSSMFSTLTFPSETHAILYDGCGHLSIFDTKRTGCTSPEWKLSSDVHPPLQSCAAQLLDSVGIVSSSGEVDLHCLMASVTEKPDDFPVRTKSSYITQLEWLTYRQTANATEWILKQHRRLVGTSFPDYASLARDAHSLHLCAERTFLPVYDSLNPDVAKKASKPSDTPMNIGSSRVSLMSTSSDVAPASEVTVPLPIHWSQSDPSNEDESGMVHLEFALSETQLPPVSGPFKPSEAVEVTITPKQVTEGQQQTLEVILTHFDESKQEKNTATLFKHQLYGFVEPDAIWTICRESTSLEVNLHKKHTLHWPRLIHDVEVDKKFVKHRTRNMSASEVEHFQEGPKATESADTVGSTTGSTLRPAFNVEQLEEVDFPLDDEDDDLILQRFDARDLQVTHQAGLSGHPWLFNVHIERSSEWTCTSAICLRHDVDGVVWVPKSSIGVSEKSGADPSAPLPWYHAATLQAFGYVLASKRDHRFVSSPALVHAKPLPFVAVADAVKRIYVYRQGVADAGFPNGDTELRRRNVEESGDTTKKVHVAWQHVVTLPVEDPIIGFLTLAKPYPACVVCTQDNVYLLSLAG